MKQADPGRAAIAIVGLILIAFVIAFAIGGAVLKMRGYA